MPRNSEGPQEIRGLVWPPNDKDGYAPVDHMLATQQHFHPSSDGWKFERVGDGFNVTAPSEASLREWITRHYDSGQVGFLMTRARRPAR